jgi:hypothetical protein
MYGVELKKKLCFSAISNEFKSPNICTFDEYQHSSVTRKSLVFLYFHRNDKKLRHMVDLSYST